MHWLMQTGCPYDRQALMNTSHLRRLNDRVRNLFNTLREADHW